MKKLILLLLVLQLFLFDLNAIDQDDYKFEIPCTDYTWHNTDIDLEQSIYTINYDNKCDFYDINTNQLISYYKKDLNIYPRIEKTFILKNKNALIVDIQGSVLFNLESKEKEKFLQDGTTRYISNVSNDKSLALDHYNLAGIDSIISFNVYDIEKREKIDEFMIYNDSLNYNDKNDKYYNLQLADASFTPISNKIVCLYRGKKNRFVIYDLYKPNSKKVININLQEEMSFAQDERIEFINDSICCARGSKFIVFLNVNNGNELKRIPFNYMISILSYTISEDKRYIFTNGFKYINGELEKCYIFYDINEKKYITFINKLMFNAKYIRSLPNSNEIYLILNDAFVRYDFKKDKILDYIASTNDGEITCITNDTLFLGGQSGYTTVDIKTEKIIDYSSPVTGESGYLLQDNDENFKELLLLHLEEESASLVLYDRFKKKKIKTLLNIDSTVIYNQCLAKASNNFEYFAIVNNSSKKGHLINKNGNIITEIYIPDVVDGFHEIINIDFSSNEKKVLFNVSEKVPFLDGWTYVAWIIIYDIETSNLEKYYSENTSSKFFSRNENNIIGKFSDVSYVNVIEKNIKTDETVKKYDLDNGYNISLMKNKKYLLGSEADSKSYLKGYNAIFGNKLFEFNLNSKNIYYNPYISPDGKYLVFLDQTGLSHKIYNLLPSSVDESIQERNITIYPNPASDYIDVVIDGAHFEGEHHLYIEIYDVLGNRVFNYEFQITNYDIPHKIDVSQLPRGVYFVKIGDRVEKFVKM